MVVLVCDDALGKRPCMGRSIPLPTIHPPIIQRIAKKTKKKHTGADAGKAEARGACHCSRPSRSRHAQQWRTLPVPQVLGGSLCVGEGVWRFFVLFFKIYTRCARFGPGTPDHPTPKQNNNPTPTATLPAPAPAPPPPSRPRRPPLAPQAGCGATGRRRRGRRARRWPLARRRR